ncbi:MAG: hypothetical protein PHN47_04120 [Clostridia bacterium]|jgi:hypothetical protein|nr:hypothetical protein [Clostridia bacterium]MDD4571650.1 hypothetical protein [Clostridia bacterium]
MDLQKKRNLFFTVVAILFFILLGLVMIHPIMQWADTCGILVAGIPMSQFLIWFSSFGMAILISITFYVDTKILVLKEKEKQ